MNVLASIAAGAIAGLVGFGAMLLSDTGGLRELAARDPWGGIALALLGAMFAATFGVAALGSAQPGTPAEDER